jgi:hypothetical protein
MDGYPSISTWNFVEILCGGSWWPTSHISSVWIFSHFGILVDCRKKSLLDGFTSFSVPAQAASSLIHSLNTITGAHR